MDCSECRDEVDVDRNTNLKIMIRKYFEQEHSAVEAEMEVVIVVIVVVVVVAATAVITFVCGVSEMYTCNRHWILRHFYVL